MADYVLPASLLGSSMKIFVSWSGEASNQVAKILKDWLPNVIQDIDIYVSSQDIASGERWLSSVNSNLEEHDFGISVLTDENIVSPWILYEAGALAKSLTTARLIPVLCGIDAISIPNHPLAQFQYVKAPIKDEMMRLLSSINSVTSRPLAPDRLEAQLGKWHQDFQTAFETVELPAKRATKQEESEQSISGQLEAVMSVQELILNQLRDLRSSPSAGGTTFANVLSKLIAESIVKDTSSGVLPSLKKFGAEVESASQKLEANRQAIARALLDPPKSGE